MSKKRGPRIAPVVRAAFMNAINNLEDKGVSLSDVIEECLMEKPLDTLRMLGSYVERDVNVDVDGDINITWTLQSPIHQGSTNGSSTKLLENVGSSSVLHTDALVKPSQPLMNLSTEP